MATILPQNPREFLYFTDDLSTLVSNYYDILPLLLHDVEKEDDEDDKDDKDEDDAAIAIGGGGGGGRGAAGTTNIGTCTKRRCCTRKELDVGLASGD
ncbi:hypothetical protein M0804_006832 [Polistes exclamans]|nr:hypothetical protein M0804_006832 [Polistes exclamans]